MLKDVKAVLAKYWGHEDFLPLQQQAIESVLHGRDSIVVLPTGGGKSLCFQAPAVLLPGLTIVVSPLIALLHRTEVSFVAVDEAHCVSTWGHDFRPEYRQLGTLKKLLPKVPIGAYTATATARVRADICEQLQLENPESIVGSFDRPNLIYRVLSRTDRIRQTCQVLNRHKGESGIIYCIRRKDVESLCAELVARGYKAAPYHAGMSAEGRKANQEAFVKEKIDTIVATIAFGMGIDKSNVRYVVHTGMPKSLEHYQQESGRAGRDGLEAECTLFYGAADYGVWKSLMSEMEPQARQIALDKLGEMYNYCTGGLCRHRALLRYFGQDLDKGDCAACDVCLGELDCMEDSLIIAQKILSCILRLRERYGASYTALVLVGSHDPRIAENRHDTLTTYGLLSEHPRHAVHNWIEQLAGQGCINKVGGYSVLTVTEKGRRVLKGLERPRLLRPATKPAREARVAGESWEGVDRGLFDQLRRLREKIADEKKVPAHIVFGDKTLREMARRRPSTDEGLLSVKGIGDTKRRQFGKAVLATIRQYCAANSVEMGG